MRRDDYEILVPQCSLRSRCGINSARHLRSLSAGDEISPKSDDFGGRSVRGASLMCMAVAKGFLGFFAFKIEAALRRDDVALF